jgi:hypothetical protein
MSFHIIVLVAPCVCEVVASPIRRFCSFRRPNEPFRCFIDWTECARFFRQCCSGWNDKTSRRWAAPARNSLGQKCEAGSSTWEVTPNDLARWTDHDQFGHSGNLLGLNLGQQQFCRRQDHGTYFFLHRFQRFKLTRTSDEYTGTNGQVGASNTLGSDVIDLSTAGSGARTSTILAEVCRKITNPVANGYYPVYVDLKRGHAGYCAYHSWGKCGSTNVQFAFFWNLDGDAGCDPQDTSGQHSQGLAALANVSAHELSEARTDPVGTGWFDSSGAENGDKCAWTFNIPLITFTNNSRWKVQGEWSNNAYNSGTGYPNSSGQKGCLDGH